MSNEALKMRGQVHGTKDAKVAIGSGVGAVIETYDFIGFGTAAALYFGTAFFPTGDPVTGTLAAFATLGVGFAARPIGGIIGGHLGDKVGRKPVLVASLILMGVATFLIGLLPTYEQVGLLAPALLVFVRIVQGLAFGAEWGGAILMSYEHAPWKSKGKYTGIVQAGFPVGLLLANLVFLVSVNLGGELAWRVPFLASIVLVAVGLIIRSKVPESPVFDEVKESGSIVKSPITEVIKTDWRSIVRGIGLRIAETAGYAVSITYMISYLHTQQLADKTETLVALCIARPSASSPPWPGPASRTGSVAVPCTSGLRLRRPVRHPHVPAGQHRNVHLRHRHHRHLLRRLPELPCRRPGPVVPGTVPGQDPLLRRLPGVPDLRHGLRLHPLRHHPPVRSPWLDGPGAPLQLLRSHRPLGRPRHPGNLGQARAPAGR